MIFHCGNVRTRVEGSAEELRWLGEYLSVPVKGAEYSEAFIAHRWDGKERLFNARSQTFATGLLRPIMLGAVPAGFTFDLLDERERPQAAFDWFRAAWLRSYQRDALEAFLKRTRGILKMPTGSGKTEVFCALGAGFPTLPTLVLVDTRDLMEQAAERYEKRTGARAGRVGDGAWHEERFTVGMLQTLHSQLKEPQAQALLDRTQVLVVDEVQVLPAKTYEAVANRAVNAYWRLGTSATPVGRSDARDYQAVGVLGGICHEVTREVLVEAGVVARSEVYFVTCDHPRTTGSFAAVYDALVAMEGRRNDLVLELIRRAPRPTLVFVRRVPHGHLLNRAIGKELGLRSEFVHGATEARAPALERLQRGDVDVLVCSKVFNKGVDIPLAASAVNAAAGESSIDSLQRLGRLSRVSGKKTSFVFLDVWDRGVRVLEKHSAARVAALLEDGHKVDTLDLSDLSLKLGA